MANTPSDEPKAPIVRIRKKRTKKKKQDVVHLPVRASRTARYSSLTTPTNPQSKGRECCRHIFASCFKIPVCRTLCFRCILPKCYDGAGSDEDDGEARDEGYHSQNRRSSEITPPNTGGTAGATGGATDIEMTEIKTETVTLIPRPRNTLNDYKKQVCKTVSAETTGDPPSATTESEVTYIEVESVSLPGDTIYIPENNLLSEISEMVNLSGQDTDTKATVEYATVTEQCNTEVKTTTDDTSIPVTNVIEETHTVKSSIDKVEVPTPTVVDTSEYVECDTDESQYYVNEDVLFRPAVENTSDPTSNHTADKQINYANFDAANLNVESGLLHSRSSSDGLPFKKKASSVKSHEYVNFKASSASDKDVTTEREFHVAGMVKTSSSEFKKLLDKSGMRFAKEHKSKSLKSYSNRDRRVELPPPIPPKGDTEKLIKEKKKEKEIKQESKEESSVKVVNTSDNDMTNKTSPSENTRDSDQAKLL